MASESATTQDVEMSNASSNPAFDFSAPVAFPTTNDPTNSSLLSIKVTKPSPYTFDLAYLCASDPNPLPTATTSSSSDHNTLLKSTARDGAQSLLNQLLLTCPISSTSSGLLMTLPAPSSSSSTFHLPRAKPLPTPKPPTKWETFARKKGIGKYNTSSGGAKEEERRKKLVYDEEKGDWVPKWGYKGKNKDGEGDWLVEVDEKKREKEEKGAGEGKTVRGEGRRERMERVRRNERKRRANEKRGRKGGGL